jgi:hypothetical protein
MFTFLLIKFNINLHQEKNDYSTNKKQKDPQIQKKVFHEQFYVNTPHKKGQKKNKNKNISTIAHPISILVIPRLNVNCMNYYSSNFQVSIRPFSHSMLTNHCRKFNVVK